MGGVQGFKKELPEDLHRSSAAQLQTLIDSMIASHPWQDDSSAPFHQRLQQTKDEMQSRGFRPITTAEYQEELTAASRNKGNIAPIRLWKPIEGFQPRRLPQVPDSITTPTSTAELVMVDKDLQSTCPSLPRSKEAITDEWAGQVVASMDTIPTSISQLDTEEWPTAS